MGNSLATKTTLPPLQTVAHCDTAKFMGTWFVIGVKPTMLETTCSNAVERYTLLDRPATAGGGQDHDVDIDFTYNKNEPISSPLKSLPQKGWVQGDDRSDSGEWRVSPFWPIKMPYPIIELDGRDYQYVVVGYPSRQYCWIMSRRPAMERSTYDMLIERLATRHQYDLEGLREVPQVWTKEERERRGLSKEELPDKYLSSKQAESCST
mmetsp:Transcript_24076/g.58138  ORF Transcript_24076/g.58138 Transcript_24076/m.58138 type:complete len:208 (+) Transcript_24076:106-729(+)